MNSVLSDHNLPLISDLRTSVGDGYTLPALLEIIGMSVCQSCNTRVCKNQQAVTEIQLVVPQLLCQDCTMWLQKHAQWQDSANVVLALNIIQLHNLLQKSHKRQKLSTLGAEGLLLSQI